jgi:hypothetical protein
VVISVDQPPLPDTYFTSSHEYCFTSILTSSIISVLGKRCKRLRISARNQLPVPRFTNVAPDVLHATVRVPAHTVEVLVLLSSVVADAVDVSRVMRDLGSVDVGVLEL